MNLRSETWVILNLITLYSSLIASVEAFSPPPVSLMRIKTFLILFYSVNIERHWKGRGWERRRKKKKQILAARSNWRPWLACEEIRKLLHGERIRVPTTHYGAEKIAKFHFGELYLKKKQMLINAKTNWHVWVCVCVC